MVKVFLSYAWINDDGDPRVRDFTGFLRDNGYAAEIDVMYAQTQTATHFTEMMSRFVRKSDKVIIVLSELYKEKADEFVGGVGTEYRYIINDIEQNISKYVLVSFDGINSSIVPDFLSGRNIIDLCTDEKQDFRQLFAKLSDKQLYNFPPVSPTQTVPNTEDIGTFSPNAYLKDSVVGEEKNPSFASSLGLDFSPPREFTDLDKKRFLKSSYNEIIDGLSRLGDEYQKLNPHFTLEIEQIDSVTTYFTVYDCGMKKTSKSIFLGAFGGMGDETIMVGECNRNSGIVASISYEIKDNDLQLKPTFGFGFGFSGQVKIRYVNDVIKLFWEHYLMIK